MGKNNAGETTKIAYVSVIVRASTFASHSRQQLLVVVSPPQINSSVQVSHHTKLSRTTEVNVVRTHHLTHC